MTPSIAEIRAKIGALQERTDTHAIAIHADQKGQWPSELSINGKTYRLAWCESPLELRLSLRAARKTSDCGLVLITPLTEADIGSDVLARLSRAKVFRVHQWALGARQAV